MTEHEQFVLKKKKKKKKKKGTGKGGFLGIFEVILGGLEECLLLG